MDSTADTSHPSDGDIVLLPNFCRDLVTQIDPELLVCQAVLLPTGEIILVHGDTQVTPAQLGARQLIFQLCRLTFFGKAVWMVTGADE